MSLHEDVKKSAERAQSKYEFFGLVDRRDRRQEETLTGHFPAWYFDQNIEELKESISEKENAIKQGLIIPEQEQIVTHELNKEKKRLVDIEASMPKLNGGQQSRMNKVAQEMLEQIRDSSPYRDDYMYGTSFSPHKELNRWETQYVRTDPEIAMACGIRPSREGKVTGQQAQTIVKILRKALGEDTHSDIFVRSQKTGVYRSHVSMEDMERS